MYSSKSSKWLEFAVTQIHNSNVIYQDDKIIYKSSKCIS